MLRSNTAAFIRHFSKMQGNASAEKLKTDAKQSVDKTIKALTQSNFTRQIIVGTASGWVSGIAVAHAGKGVAAVVGSSIILLQIAQHKGLITSDWHTLKDAVEKKSCEISTKYSNQPQVIKVKDFAQKNKAFTAGFLGGFLLGIAT